MAQERTHSAIVENYIKNIYILQNADGRVTTSLLSEKLSVTPASATDMLKRLAEDGMLIHERYKGAELTPKGKALALKIIRRHRLWELFLSKVLQFEWHELHEEAERLEHSTSDALEAKLDAYLGHPTVDPHGHDIPRADGKIVEKDYISLAETAENQQVTIRRVNDDSAEVLKYASSLGIGIGIPLRIVEKIAFDGSVRVQIDGKEQYISAKLASCVFVQ